MNQDMIGLLDLVVASIGIIITLAIAGGGMLWRMHAAQNKRMDHMQRDLTHRMDIVTAELRTSLTNRMDTVTAELRTSLTNRMDIVTAELRTSLTNRMDIVTAELRTSLETSTTELRTSLETVATELRQGQQILAESLSKLDSRISRLEGMLQPRPWVEASPAHPESSPVT